MSLPLGSAGQVIGTNSGATALTNLTAFVQGSSGANGIILGTNTNDSAASGVVGEIISSTVSVGSAVSLTTATTANVTSISLTAGDWDVSGLVGFNAGGTTTVTYIIGGASTTTATLGAFGTYVQIGWTNGTFLVDYVATFPVSRISIASTTTVFLIANSAFAVSTMKAYGIIRARRVR